MAKGSYNISVARDSNLQKDGKKNNESECMNSCLAPAFLKSWSFHDRRRSSRVQAEKQLLKSQYKALLSSSLEKIPYNPSPPSEEISSQSPGFEPFGINAEFMVPIHDASNQQTTQNSSDSWLEDSSSVESDRLLEKTIAILRTLDTDIAESLTNLTRPESIALESVMEVYRNKGKTTENSSAGADLDLSTKSCCEPIYENWQPPFQQRLSTESCSEPIYENWQPRITKRPRDVLTCSTPQTPKNFHDRSNQQSSENLQAHSSQQSLTNLQACSSQQSLSNLQARSSQQSPTNLQARSSQQSPTNLQALSSQQSPYNLQALSSQQSPTNLQARSFQQSLTNLQPRSSQQSLADLQAHSSQQSSTNLQTRSPCQSLASLLAHSSLQSPTNLPANSSQQILMNLLTRSPCQDPNNVQPHSSQQSSNLSVLSDQETFQNLSLLSLNSRNSQSLIKPDSDKVRSVELSPRNLPSPKINAPNDTSLIEFNLPSDHEQFLKIIGALQNRCLEYREMIRDIAISTLEECLNFSELSIGRIRQLRKQFSSQKRNFTDFKELCCKSVVFGPDSQPIDQKVTEMIQSFYLKLLQEENETFLVRLEFGLKMAEVYFKMLKLETESKKTITTLEKEILYLKKTSVGFRV